MEFWQHGELFIVDRVVDRVRCSEEYNTDRGQSIGAGFIVGCFLAVMKGDWEVIYMTIMLVVPNSHEGGMGKIPPPVWILQFSRAAAPYGDFQ